MLKPFVAYRISKQHYNASKRIIENGYFMYGQYNENEPDEIALNWCYLGSAESEEAALAILKTMREESLKRGVRFNSCPIYSNGGYAYKGTYQSKPAQAGLCKVATCTLSSSSSYFS